MAGENSKHNNTNNGSGSSSNKQKQPSKQQPKQPKEEPLNQRRYQRRKKFQASSTTTCKSHHPHQQYLSNNNKQRAALAHIEDMASVQLEQAVRDLNCFEDLNTSNGDNHRAFALEYLEAILTRWCRLVEEQTIQKRNSQQQQEQQGKGHANTASSSPPSFAAVAAGTNKSNSPPKSFAQAVAPKSNVWQRPPASATAAEDAPTQQASSSSSPAAALIPFGSYRLGAHSTESDFDLLALAPPNVHRSDFFTSLVKLLREDERCQQVHPIPSAYTPVIKFLLDCGDSKSLLQVDLVFARVADATKLIEYQKQKALQKQQQTNGGPAPAAPVEYHLDDSDLQDLDEAGVRSLNGARVSQMILEYVPDKAKFQTVLRAVKHWAVATGIYSNVLGFLGGVNWAIMTAYICKQFPELDAASTLHVFFRTFASWQWNHPVMLFPTVAEVPPITNVSKQSRAVYLPAWNPQTNPRDGLHIMPIITPAYPSMNSSYNVDMPQLRRMKEEMIRASNLLQQRHHQKPRKGKDSNIYRRLFAPSDFFGQHRHFLRIDIVACSEQDFVEWFRLVESRIRILISNLDTPQVHAWPFARFFTVRSSDPSYVPGSLQKCFFIGLRFAQDLNEINIQHLTMDFLHKINSWEGRKAGMDLSMQHVLDDGIPLYVWEDLRSNNHCSTAAGRKNWSDQSVDSENTAPATEDEEEEHSYNHCSEEASAGSNKSLSTTPTKKLCRDSEKQQPGPAAPTL